MRRIEVNPGEMFAVSNKVILMREFESLFGMSGKFGRKDNKLTYALTFRGKLNNQAKQADVTVLISPEDMVNMTTTMMGQVEWLDMVLEAAAKQAERGGQ